MDNLAESERIAEAQNLLAELKAIELWDTCYWRGHRHEDGEMIALINRRERRSQILNHLLTIIKKLEK
jgi:hypothetical protein